MKIKSFFYKAINDIVYIPIYYLLYRKKFQSIDIKTIEETIDSVTEKGVSISRFGDGEFKWIDMTGQKSFEKDSKELSSKLLEVLNSDDKQVAIALPQAFKDPSILTANKYWEREMGKYGKQWLNDINLNSHYYNVNITRPYMDLRNKKIANYVFDKFKEFMENKDILIIEGTETHFGEGNDLLKNVNSIKRVECPAHNAFESYDDIYNHSVDVINKWNPDVVLTALGPTATVLTFDLTKKTKKQVIDIGHFDIEYEWYLKKDNKREPISGKAVNEIKDK